ncbi:M12 family metallopeptidase [Pseudomonas fluorescens]|uniref:M12 family metallopeptidase n=1 Tax=Pseudomonas fluorescens TaxID=294 RepID=UPI001161181A|nr:M12 family metallopeptidase [Pseudomonas fluorescens]
MKIAMYDADPAFVKKVKEAASKWLPHINLKFDFVSGDEGDIRIAQTRISKQGSSAIGTDALKMPEDGPTMLLPHDHQDPRFAYVVTHEFGHVIGALHAHQHPDTEIPWKTSVAYSAYNLGLGKSKDQVDAQILPLPRKDTYQYEPYDRHSIMHYDINKLTTSGGWEQRESWELSAGDIALASKAYPRITSATPSSPRSYPTLPELPEEYRRLWRDSD